MDGIEISDLQMASQQDQLTTDFPCNVMENVKSFVPCKDSNDNEPIHRVCRLCLGFALPESYVSVKSPQDDSSTLEELIVVCLPKVNLALTTEPLICSSCAFKLSEYHDFVSQCAKSEDQIVNYCVERNIPGPVDICSILSYNIQQSASLAIKQENSAEYDESLPAANVKVEIEVHETKQVDLNTTRRSRRAVRKGQLLARKKLTNLKRKSPHSKDLLKEDVTCEKCDKHFTSKWALDRHVATHNTVSGNYMCDICGMAFKYKASQEKHASTHITGAPPNKPFACECGKYFSRRVRLIQHQARHVKRDKPYGCDSCGKRFLEEKLLESHIERVHVQEKPFACELCGNKYITKNGLDVHQKTHFPDERPRPIPDLMCDFCGKLFHRRYTLEKHRMSHTGDKPHKCDQCNMKFKERYQLIIHVRRHTGEKPFKCELCPFKCASKNRLRVHMRVHTGDRPFPCQLCSMAFSRNDHLIKHVRAIHTGERPFECDICSKTFNRKDYLIKHKKVHFKCPGSS